MFWHMARGWAEWYCFTWPRGICAAGSSWEKVKAVIGFSTCLASALLVACIRAASVDDEASDHCSQFPGCLLLVILHAGVAWTLLCWPILLLCEIASISSCWINARRSFMQDVLLLDNWLELGTGNRHTCNMPQVMIACQSQTNCRWHLFQDRKFIYITWGILYKCSNSIKIEYAKKISINIIIFFRKWCIISLSDQKIYPYLCSNNI